MSPDRWSTIKSLFEEALERPQEERAAWLETASAGDNELRQEVERLLEVNSSADQYFDTLGSRLHTDARVVEPVPETIGPWKILREAGRGGMGRVFEAVRDDGLYDQRVAIKVVDSHSPRLVARFQQERRILATLEHPNICRLLDGGTLEDGRPYLVMEFVEGEPITAYADRVGLSVDDRLGLFDQVCEAVAFAHRHLVIHRDLKPSNVLVALSGRVKLLDFGIAKLLDENGDADHKVTKTGRRLLTPHFASPEQILDQSITTATDVYTLGVLLYALLTGGKPFGRTGGSQHEVEKEILEKQPTAPSSFVAKSHEAKLNKDRTRTDRVKLGRRLKGDLDRIVLKALRKEPERRYASVEAFQRDIQQHLRGLPVDASPATVAYRFSSFVKRHRTGVLVTLVGALVVGALGTLSAKRITEERDRAEYVGDFLQDILSTADDPGSNPSALLSLLAPAVERAEQELAAQPGAQAEVFHVVGGLYDKAGRPDLARRLLGRALTIRQQVYPNGNEEVAETLYALGKVFIGEDQDSSAYYFEKSAEHYGTLSTGESSELAWAILQWSRMLPLDRPEKRPMLEEALRMLRRFHGDRSTEVADALHEYYVLGYGGGTGEQVEAAFEESIAIYAEHGMEDHPFSIHAMHNLGTMLDGRGESERAMELLRRSVDLARSSLEEGVPSRFSMEVNLGATLHERGIFEEADGYLREAAGQTVRYLPDSASGIGFSHYWFGRNLNALQRYPEAEVVLNTALGVQRLHDPIGNRTMRTQAEYALTLHELGEQSRAERLVSEAIDRLAGTGYYPRALEQGIVIFGGSAQASEYRSVLNGLE